MFRYLTLLSKKELKLDVLLEVNKRLQDIYYHDLKIQGALDYISQFVTPEENIFGIRIDKELNYPYTILTKKIDCQNIVNLIGQVKYLRGI